MSAQRRNEPIAAWQDTDRVSGFALLSRKDLRQDRNGRDFLDMELTDASGSIAAKVWSDSPAMNGSFEAPGFVAFRGVVSSYRKQLQIAIQECRQATADDEALGFDPRSLVPTTHEDIDDLWRRLETALDAGLSQPPLRQLAERTLAAHGAALREHPAAMSIHHAYRGGLLEHVVSMLELSTRLSRHYPELDEELLLLGVLFHDLGKLEELGAMPANEYTPVGRLVGHVVLGRDMLRTLCAEITGFPAELQLQLEHLVLSHHGRREYGAAVEPMTPEALALHFLDDLDSKLNQLRGARRQGSGFSWVKGLGRYVWVGTEEVGTGALEAAQRSPVDSGAAEVTAVGDAETDPATDDVRQPRLDLA